MWYALAPRMMVLSTSKKAATVRAPSGDAEAVIPPAYLPHHKHLFPAIREAYRRRMAARVILFTRSGCHLCADARPVVDEVCSRARVDWEEVDVDSDLAAAETYSDLVPAVTVDGILRGFWRIDPEKLHAFLK